MTFFGSNDSSGPGKPLADVLIIEDLSQQRLPARRLAAVLQHAGWRAQLLHFGSDTDPLEIISRARDAQPRLIVFSILFGDRLRENLCLISNLRDAGSAAHITMTGPLPGFAHNSLLEACPGLDSVLCGEAEAIVVPLVAVALDREKWQALDGIAYRSHSPCVNVRPKGPTPLDDLPFPTREANQPFSSDCGFATIESSRGCYHACTFCLPCAFYAKQGAGYRLRSVPNLVDEVEQLYRLGTRLFLFDDEQFLPPPQIRLDRVAALGRELERRDMSIAFTIKCRPDDVDAGLFRRLKELGLVRVYIGIESGCQASLDLFGKGVTVERSMEALATLDTIGIVADFRTLIFHPWSTTQTIIQDVAFLGRVVPFVSTCFTFNGVEIYQGTPLARRLIEEGRAEGDPWLPNYTIRDPRAELLRRICRFVFGPTGIYSRLQSHLTQAWFDLLLHERFDPGEVDPSRRLQLKGIVTRVNRASLEVWGEMLEFVCDGDINAVDQVNNLAEVCVSQINIVCARIEDELG